jgi:hypothetical protein
MAETVVTVAGVQPGMERGRCNQDFGNRSRPPGGGQTASSPIAWLRQQENSGEKDEEYGGPPTSFHHKCFTTVLQG